MAAVTATFSLDISSILKEKLQQVRKEWGIWLTLQRSKTSARGWWNPRGGRDSAVDEVLVKQVRLEESMDGRT